MTDPSSIPVADLLAENDFLRTLFEAIPCGIIVVDEAGRVQAVNDVVKRTFHASNNEAIQRAAGDALGCFHALHDSGGCGKSEFCQNCQVRHSAELALEGKRIFRHRAEMRLAVGGQAHETSLLVSAAPVEYDGQKLAIVVLEDITELTRLRRQLHTEQGFAGIIGRDPKMLELFDSIRELAEVNVPVLIQGESGTGKELVAAAIHSQGPRAAKPFVAVNCGALPDELFEAELFGHVKGAFSGALRDRRGRFELAHEGTIFLDEIADLSPPMQVKLLRVLQEGTFEPVGSEKTVQVDVRIVSATNKNLDQEVAAGAFREDLFYRLSIVPITMPPLRERPNDIPLLAKHFLEQIAQEWQREEPKLSVDVLAALVEYRWPGNVRELQSALSYAMVKCKAGVIELKHLPAMAARPDASEPTRVKRRRKLDAEKVNDALQRAGGNKSKAAVLLGVSRATLYRFIDELEGNDAGANA